MKKAILIRFLLIIILALVICCSVTGYFISKSMLDTTVQDMYQTIHVLEHILEYDNNLQENLLTITEDVFTDEMRVTIVTTEGIVVADSSIEDIASLENHIEREEIRSAIDSGFGYATRYSQTLHTNMLYVTRLTVDGNYVIRLSEPYHGLTDFAKKLLPIIIVGIISALVVTIIVGWRLSDEITKPIIAISREMEKVQKIDEPFQFSQSRYEELNQISTSARKMSESIREHVASLEMEKKIRQEFFSNASHELKTPITSIKGYTELLSQGFGIDDSMQKDFYQRIMKETDNMTNLINDILMISRLEANENVEVLSEVRMCPLVDEILESMGPIAKDYQVTLHSECKPICIKSSPKQMRELILNLVNNGVKYNKPGGDVWVNIDCQTSDIMVIRIRDNGVGISEEDQKRIFERFYRVDKGRSKKSGGTGLGLSIVKHVVEYNKGEIQLESTLGEGSCFTIKIPVEIIYS